MLMPGQPLNNPATAARQALLRSQHQREINREYNHQP